MIIFAHGLEGTPNGSKIQTLRNSGIEVIAPDFQGMPLIGGIGNMSALLKNSGL